MKSFSNLSFLSISISVIVFFSSCYGVNNKIKITGTNTSNTDSAKSIAVLELFTSQGCSSCPPADRLLGGLSSKQNVIVLSFHVDYWNRYGWKDPFSSADFSKRQTEYASALHSDVYTPQLIVNGVSEMIGSDEGKINSAIDKVFTQQPEASLSIQSVKNDKNKAIINFNVTGNINKSTLNIAVVEKQTTTVVKAGENGGNTLVNYNVVRNFETLYKVKSGDNVASIDVPADDIKNRSVIIFLQQKNNKITAAAQAGFE